MSRNRKTWVRTLKECTSSALLMTLILQMGITSLLCATSSYQANANTITLCSPMGLKTITLDESGEPVENDQQHTSFQKMCFHCATGCGMAAQLSNDQASVTLTQASQRHLAPKSILIKRGHLATGPPSRAPPHSA